MATKLFPSSLKNILAGKQGFKKDNVTQVLENLIRLFLPMGTSGRVVVEQTLYLMSLLFKSREKPKIAFREWIQRILSNIVLYLNAVTPRYFDDVISSQNQEIDLNTAFEFVFDRSQGSQVDKLLIKDFSATETLGGALLKLETMFTLLKYSL